MISSRRPAWGPFPEADRWGGRAPRWDLPLSRQPQLLRCRVRSFFVFFSPGIFCRCFCSGGLEIVNIGRLLGQTILTCVFSLATICKHTSWQQFIILTELVLRSFIGMVFLCTVSAKINPTTRLWPRATPSTQVHRISRMFYNHSPCCFLTQNLFRSCHIFHNYRFRNVQQSWRKSERLHLCIGLLNWNIITCIVTLYYLFNALPWWSN